MQHSFQHQLLMQNVCQKSRLTTKLKQNVFESLDKICKPSCIFASNTSGFVIAEIAAKCSDERKKIFGGMQCAPTRQLTCECRG